MGTHAERVAIKDGVSREDQDAFALAVHQQAVAAIDEGRFDAELAPVTVRDAKGRETVVTVDESPRRDTTARGAREAAARVRPARAARTAASATVGTVTAGNAPGITDGAAATVVASRAGGRAPTASSRSPGSSATRRPRSRRSWLFLAPVEGVRRRSRRRPGCRSTPTTWSRSTRRSPPRRWPTAASSASTGTKVNVNGGAIALGHPIGASGRPDRRHAAPRAAAPRAAATASRRSASAAAARSRWPSSGSDGGFERRAVGDTRSMTDRAVTDAPTGARSRPTSCSSPGRWVDGVGGETFESVNPADTPRRRRAVPGGNGRGRRDGGPGGRDRRGRGWRRDARRPSAARSCTASARCWPSTRSASPAR